MKEFIVTLNNGEKYIILVPDRMVLSDVINVIYGTDSNVRNISTWSLSQNDVHRITNGSDGVTFRDDAVSSIEFK